jgi:hypothetical protein
LQGFELPHGLDVVVFKGIFLLGFFLGYFAGIASTSRRLKGGNIKKEILAIKTKFPS